MPKITFDVSNSDPDKATQDVEPPKPGVYLCKVAEINPGFSKDDDGKPDKDRPRLEVVYRIHKGNSKGAPLWDYLSFSEAAQWKLDQFLQAVGVANKKKRKGSFDSSKVIGKLVKVRVTGQGSGEDYRARVRGVFAYDPDLEEEETEEDEDENGDEEEEEEETEEEETEEEEEEDDEVELDEDDLDQLGAEADAGGKPGKVAEKRLTELAEERDLDPDEYPTWAELAEALKGDADEEGEEEEDDGYDEMDLKALKKEAKSRGLVVKGTAEALKARLRKHDSEEDPF